VRECIADQVQLPGHSSGMVPQQQDVSMMLHVPAGPDSAWCGYCQWCNVQAVHKGTCQEVHWLTGYMAASKGFTDVCCAEVVYIPDHRVAMLRQPPLDAATQVCLRTSTQPRRWVASSCACHHHINHGPIIWIRILVHWLTSTPA
jgi:hypothetical protein